MRSIGLIQAEIADCLEDISDVNRDIANVYTQTAEIFLIASKSVNLNSEDWVEGLLSKVDEVEQSNILAAAKGMELKLKLKRLLIEWLIAQKKGNK